MEFRVSPCTDPSRPSVDPSLGLWRGSDPRLGWNPRISLGSTLGGSDPRLGSTLLEYGSDPDQIRGYKRSVPFLAVRDVLIVRMVARTRRCYEQHARGEMHPYRRLCKKTYAIFEQQRSCTAVAHMLALIKQGKQLFYSSVALMHICQISNGNARCAICADGDAYGNRRPPNESPDSFPLLSRVPNVPELTSEYEALLKL